MSAVVFDGRAEAEQRREILARKVNRLKTRPKLVAVIVGDDPASRMYVSMKGRAAKSVGISFLKEELKAENGRLRIDDVVLKVDVLSQDPTVTGLMVQLPLPDGIRGHTDQVLDAINPAKDVDGLTAENLGRLVENRPRFVPATVKAIESILETALKRSNLKRSNLGRLDLSGKQVVIVGRSNIVGKPLAALLTNCNATVTLAHSKTKNLGRLTYQADVLVAATGRAGLIKKDMVKPGAIVIDVGEPKPDVEESVRQVASFVSPVPGGVGPMTVVSLLENVVQV